MGLQYDNGRRRPAMDRFANPNELQIWLQTITAQLQGGGGVRDTEEQPGEYEVAVADAVTLAYRERVAGRDETSGIVVPQLRGRPMR